MEGKAVKVAGYVLRVVMLPVLIASLAGCGNSGSANDPESVVTVTETPSAPVTVTETVTPSETPTDSPTAAQSDVPAGPAVFGKYAVPSTVGYSVVDSVWVPGESSSDYGMGGVIFYNNGPGVAGIKVTADLVNAQGETVGSVDSGVASDRPVPANSFVIVPLFTDSAPTAVGLDNIEFDEEADSYSEPLTAGAEVTMELPATPGSGMKTTIVNKAQVEVEDLDDLIIAGFVGEKLDWIRWAFVQRTVSPGATETVFAKVDFWDVPRRTTSLLGYVNYGIQ